MKKNSFVLPLALALTLPVAGAWTQDQPTSAQPDQGAVQQAPAQGDAVQSPQPDAPAADQQPPAAGDAVPADPPDAAPPTAPDATPPVAAPNDPAAPVQLPEPAAPVQPDRPDVAPPVAPQPDPANPAPPDAAPLNPAEPNPVQPNPAQPIQPNPIQPAPGTPDIPQPAPTPVDPTQPAPGTPDPLQPDRLPPQPEQPAQPEQPVQPEQPMATPDPSAMPPGMTLNPLQEFVSHQNHEIGMLAEQMDTFRAADRNDVVMAMYHMIRDHTLVSDAAQNVLARRGDVARPFSMLMSAPMPRTPEEIIDQQLRHHEEELPKVQQLLADAGTPEEKSIYQRSVNAINKHLNWLRAFDQGRQLQISYFGPTPSISRIAGYRQTSSVRQASRSQRQRRRANQRARRASYRGSRGR